VAPEATGATAAGRTGSQPTAPVDVAAVAAAPAPPAPAQSAAATLGPQPTGPVDYVPGPPRPGVASTAPSTTPSTTPTPTPTPTTAPSPAVAPPGSRDDFLGDLLADTPRRSRAPRSLRRLATTVLPIAALALLEVGLVMHVGDRTLWSDVPLWSAFATLAALLGLALLVPRLPGGRRVPDGTRWTVATAGLVGVGVFWLLVVLPSVATDRGFVLTAALGCLGGSVWLAADRSPVEAGTPAAAPSGNEEPAQRL
jgi:hypothetical protein